MMKFFPIQTPRPKQVKAIGFLEEALRRDYRKVVIAGPTGFGKSAIGATLCLWAQSEDAAFLDGMQGGYYLVTQKPLQDQLERDFVDSQTSCALIKSASNYTCTNPRLKTCDVGQRRRCKCSVYVPVRDAFLASIFGITNYAYFLTEKFHVGRLPKRRVLVLDECQNIERLLIRFFDIIIGKEQLDDVEVFEDPPEFKHIDQFLAWCEDPYRPRLVEKYKDAVSMVEMHDDPRYSEKATRLSLQLQKLERAIASMQKDRSSWIMWTQEDQKGNLETIARPLYAHEFAAPLFNSGDAVIFMSAHPGEQKLFCRSLGLTTEEVAWSSFGSTFPVENRPIRMTPIGSMGRKSYDQTLPALIRVIAKILEKHVYQKGLIHCQSYRLGEAVFKALQGQFPGRLIFPTTAEEREPSMVKHAQSLFPTVMISPSMTEGFDFAGKLAEFQIVAKCPFPSLGDRHVLARKDLDESWYALETCKTLVQACGRIVRSESDVGITYILDSDVEMLLNRYGHFFPNWWSTAIVRTPSTKSSQRPPKILRGPSKAGG